MLVRLLILVSFVLIGHSSFVCAQTPLPPEGSSWFSASFGMMGYQNSQTHILQGDTTIQGVDYKKLLGGNLNYFGCLRSEGDRWYSVPSGLEEEYLLYDFGLAVGDTFWVDHPQLDIVAPYLIVNSIDTITLNDNSQRKRWRLEYENPDPAPDIFDALFGYGEWIDGVGSTMAGPLDVVSCGSIDCGWSELICFSNDSQLLYEDNPGVISTFLGELVYYIYSDCSITLGKPELSALSFSLYPNPTSQEFIVEREESVHSANWSVLSLEGRLVLEGTIPAGEKTLRMSAAEIPEGIYLFKLKSPSSSVTSRLLVRH